VGAQELVLVAPEDSGAGAHQVEGLGRALGRLDQHGSVRHEALRGAERRAVGAVRAPHHRIDPRIRAERAERVRHVGLEVAVAPRVERVAVAPDGTDDARGLAARGGRERGQLEPDARRDVENELGVPARVGDHPDPPARGAPGTLAAGQRLGHLVHVVDLDRPVRAEDCLEHARFAGEAAGVARDRAAGPLAPADLQHHHRLAVVGGAVERGHEPIRLSHGLEEHRDHPRGRVIDQVLEHVGGHDHRLVARRDHAAPAEAPAVGEQPDDDRSALGDEPDVAGERRGVAERVQVDEAPLVRTDDAHAVRPAEGDARLMADGDQLVLPLPPRLVALGEPGVERDRGPHALLGRGAEAVEHPLVVDAEREHVDAVGQLLERSITAPPQQALVAWIDRVDLAGEPHAVAILDDGAADRGPFGGAEHGDRARLQERVELDDRSSDARVAGRARW
jgi:hypothetical protein